MRFASLAMSLFALLSLCTVSRSEQAEVIVPASRPLMTSDGREIRLTELEDRDVVVSFTIVSCTQICLTSDMVMDIVAEKARAQSKDLLLLTLTLDPRQDTPEVLVRMIEQRNIDRQRTMLTGRESDVVSVLSSIGIYDRTIEGHPLMFLVKRKGELGYRKIERDIGPAAILEAF